MGTVSPARDGWRVGSGERIVGGLVAVFRIARLGLPGCVGLWRLRDVRTPALLLRRLLQRGLGPVADERLGPAASRLTVATVRAMATVRDSDLAVLLHVAPHHVDHAGLAGLDAAVDDPVEQVRLNRGEAHGRHLLARLHQLDQARSIQVVSAGPHLGDPAVEVGRLHSAQLEPHAGIASPRVVA